MNEINFAILFGLAFTFGIVTGILLYHYCLLQPTMTYVINSGNYTIDVGENMIKLMNISKGIVK